MNTHSFLRRVLGLAGALAVALAVALGVSPARAQQVNVLCSTDQGWCEAAAKAFEASSGIRVLQSHKATGEALAQLRAEAANPKTDLWWGGTGDPYLQAAEVGLLDAYRPDYLNDLHGWAVRQYAMSENYVGGFYTSTSAPAGPSSSTRLRSSRSRSRWCKNRRRGSRSSRTGAPPSRAGRRGKRGDKRRAGRLRRPAGTGRRCRPTTDRSSGWPLLHATAPRLRRWPCALAAP